MLTLRVKVVLVFLAAFALASAQFFDGVPAPIPPMPPQPDPVAHPPKMHPAAAPLRPAVTLTHPTQAPHHPVISSFLTAMSDKISKCTLEPKPGDVKACVKCIMEEDKKMEELKERKAEGYCMLKMATRMQKIVLLTLALVAVASAHSFSSSISESGSLNSLGGPQEELASNPMGESVGQQRKLQGPQGGDRKPVTSGGRFFNPNTPVSPIAALLRGKMEMCGRYANYGDIDECVDCILDEDKKLKSLKKQKARSFCQSKRFFPF